ncbi:MAG TPA: HAD-IC family P-type ATPase, partial [Kribbellaceae bacterium]|nr:HAD-IC family P-type ATPase [Kribbellaceae bacterium]
MRYDAVPAPVALRDGLSDAAARAALEQYGPNTIPEPRPPRAGARALAQLRDPMILLLLGAAVLTAVLHDVSDLVVILVVVVLNTTVGVVQELRAERSLAALRRLTAPQARVLRSGRAVTVPAADVAPGDVVLLAAGDVVPADVELTECRRLQVDESALTGESVPVDKSTTEEAFAGTVVTAGRGAGVVTQTGPRSALGRIAGLLAAQR